MQYKVTVDASMLAKALMQNVMANESTLKALDKDLASVSEASEIAQVLSIINSVKDDSTTCAQLLSKLKEVEAMPGGLIGRSVKVTVELE